MTHSIFPKLALAGLITTLAISAVPMVQAQTSSDKIQFTCRSGFDKNTGKEQPTTYLWFQGNKHGVVRWVKARVGAARGVKAATLPPTHLCAVVRLPAGRTRRHRGAPGRLRRQHLPHGAVR